MNKVILLGHQAHVGKDMLGEYLVRNHNFIRYGFADKLKEVVADLYDFTDEHMYGNLKNVKDIRYSQKAMKDSFGQYFTLNDEYLTPRQILQDFGQEQRARFPDIWANYVFRQIEMMFSDSQTNAVITDFRFPNEYEVAQRFADKLGLELVTVKLVRSDELRYVERDPFAGAKNISETALENFEFDHVIYNNSTKEKLFDRFERLVLSDKQNAQTVKVDISFMEK